MYIYIYGKLTLLREGLQLALQLLHARGQILHVRLEGVALPVCTACQVTRVVELSLPRSRPTQTNMGQDALLGLLDLPLELGHLGARRVLLPLQLVHHACSRGWGGWYNKQSAKCYTLIPTLPTPGSIKACTYIPMVRSSCASSFSTVT